MKTATLKNWSVCNAGHPYTAPELFPTVLNGAVYDYSSGRFPDGSLITTSAIVRIEKTDEKALVQTRNTEYTHHKNDVDPDYEAAFPGAFERLGVK